MRMKSIGSDPLIQALQTNDVSALASLLNTDRGVAERFHFGRTPLHAAAESGALECTQMLVARGANLEAHDEAGHTALIYALEAGHAEVAAQFIGAGALLLYRFAPPDTLDRREQLQRQYKEIESQSRRAHEEVYRLLDEASQGLDRESFAQEMVGNFVSSALRVREVHTIHYCADLATLQLLGQQPGISWNLHDGAGYWPLKTFAESGNASAVASLLQQGAEPDFTSTGDTALHAAVARGHLECARLLLKAGAAPNQQDVDGCVPMWQVSSNEMLDLLLAHGANLSIDDQCGFKPSHWVEVPALKARLLALEREHQP